MSQSVATGAVFVTPRRLALEHRILAWLAASVVVATLSGTLVYCYPSTLGVVAPGMRLLHELSGDTSIAFSGVYLFLHLPRVWGMKRRRVSRWSGYVVLAVWVIAAATGVYGQLRPLSPGSALWLIHLTTSVAAVVIAGFHGTWGFRPHLQ